MKKLLTEIAACTLCKEHLPFGPNPVISASRKCKIVIIGQAPGAAVHKSGVPWDDKSGANLRDWLGVSNYQFYDPELFALVPMGFCYPGKGKSGDLPPRKECAPQWHKTLFSKMKDIKLTLLIGQYAQKSYLDKLAKTNLTETVRNFEEYLPNHFVLPHPSPRNNIWQAKHPWFKENVLPELKRSVYSALAC